MATHNTPDMDETTADAILLATFKGSKQKPTDLLTIAKAVRFKIGQLKSIYQVAEAFGVSHQQVREFNSLLDLPSDVQRLLTEHHTGVSKWYELSKIPDPRRQSELAKWIIDLGFNDTRAVVDFIRRHPEDSVEGSVRRVLESKTVKEDIHIIVVPLNQDAYKNLRKQSEKQSMSVENLAAKFINDALKNPRSVL
jgi:hypothetical protein